MLNNNQIQIDGNGNVTLQNIKGSTVTIYKSDDANTILTKLNELQHGQLDALRQIIEKQTEQFSDLLKILLKDIIQQKHVVSNSTLVAGGNLHIGDNIYNIDNVKITPDPVLSDFFISLSTGKNVDMAILERQYLLDELQKQIDAGHRYIVLHGDKGLGKTTFMSIYYNTYSEKKYQQKGWFKFQGNLPETYVKELTKEELEDPTKITKWANFYFNQARREVRTLNNITKQHSPFKRLIVIDDVTEEGVVSFFDDLLNINNTVFVFISQQSFKDNRFKNYALPRLKDKEVRAILDKFFSKEKQDVYIKVINGNPFISNLVIKKTPRDAEKKVQDFGETILKIKKDDLAEKDLQIVTALYDLDQITPIEEWLLLQFAALPNGAYDDFMLQAYWLPDAEEEDATLKDILALRSCQDFLAATLPTQDAQALTTLLENISEKGWLEDKEGEYELNSLVRDVLVFYKKNQYTYTAEIADCLRINFFTNQHNNLKDHLEYEKHLRHYLAFVQGVATPKYLDTLYKLVQWYEDAGKYFEELHYRKQHFALAKQYYGESSDFLIGKEADLTANYMMAGNLAKAKQHGKNALNKAYRYLSANAPLTAKCENNLGLVLKDLGDYAGAKVLLEKAMISNKANFGEKHPSTAISYSNLATVLKDLGDYNGAKVLFQKAMILDESNFGKKHPSTAISYSNLALVLKDLGDYAGAKVLLEKAMISNEANFGKNHPTTAVSYNNLAWVLKDLKEYEKAIQLAVKAYRIYAGHLGQQHPNTKIVEGIVNSIGGEMLQNDWTMEQIQKLINDVG